jgi:hypothetical protein
MSFEKTYFTGNCQLCAVEINKLRVHIPQARERERQEKETLIEENRQEAWNGLET